MSDTFDLDVHELARTIECGNAPLIVDTRSRRAYAAGHIPGALHLPFWRAGARHADLGADFDAPIVMYCALGPRAAWARRALVRRGYRRVGLLRGHFQAWKRR
jgi:rhodanese-related sulfurtransferase